MIRGLDPALAGSAVGAIDSQHARGGRRKRRALNRARENGNRGRRIAGDAGKRCAGMRRDDQPIGRNHKIVFRRQSDQRHLPPGQNQCVSRAGLQRRNHGWIHTKRVPEETDGLRHDGS